MVGNLYEWVADWVPPATGCSTSLFGTNDDNCMTIDPQVPFTPTGPGALLRGGNFNGGSGAGVFAVLGDPSAAPSVASNFIGFRAAR